MHSPCDAYPSFRLKAYISGGKFTPQICHNHKPAISSRHSIYSIYLLPVLLLHYGRPSVCTVRMMSEMLTPFSDSRHTKAEGKFTPQICRSRIFVPANECTRVVPMYPSQSAMSHLHSLAQSMYIATFLPKHVIPTCFADYVTSTSGAIRLAFDLLPLASSSTIQQRHRRDALQLESSRGQCSSGRLVSRFLLGEDGDSLPRH